MVRRTCKWTAEKMLRRGAKRERGGNVLSLSTYQVPGFAASWYLKETGVIVFYCREEEAEAQRGDVICPRSHSQKSGPGI